MPHNQVSLIIATSYSPPLVEQSTGTENRNNSDILHVVELYFCTCRSGGYHCWSLIGLSGGYYYRFDLIGYEWRLPQ